MSTFLFGLATAFPVGVQSFVVMNQGLRVGYPKIVVGIATANLCDSLLTVLGAAVAISASGSDFSPQGFGTSVLQV